MAYGQKISNGGNGQTLWLKRKTKKNRKGEEREVFQGSVDLGGGKMLKVSIDAELYTVDKDGTELLPAYVSKWKSESTQQRQNKKSW